MELALVRLTELDVNLSIYAGTTEEVRQTYEEIMHTPGDTPVDIVRMEGLAHQIARLARELNVVRATADAVPVSIHAACEQVVLSNTPWNQLPEGIQGWLMAGPPVMHIEPFVSDDNHPMEDVVMFYGAAASQAELLKEVFIDFQNEFTPNPAEEWTEETVADLMSTRDVMLEIGALVSSSLKQAVDWLHHVYPSVLQQYLVRQQEE
jgi:hypothetical protein